MLFDRVVITGVGLIGGSMALAMKQHGLAKEIVGAGRKVENLQLAVELGVIDRYTETIEDEVSRADLVVVAVPVDAMAQLLERIAPRLAQNTIVTDVGSVKGAIVEMAQRHLGSHFQNFVPGHPVAGTENSGVQAAFAELFIAHPIILTPTFQTDSYATQQIAKLWKSIGGNVLEMNVDEHDRILAATSHLPHMLAYALVNHLAKQSDSDVFFELAAGGFYDFTRIASSDAVMWRDICLHNPHEIAKDIRSLSKDLEFIAQKIDLGDGAALQQLFERAKNTRSHVGDHRQQRIEAAEE